MSKKGIHILHQTSFICEKANVIQLKHNFYAYCNWFHTRRSYAHNIIPANWAVQLLCGNSNFHQTFGKPKMKGNIWVIFIHRLLFCVHPTLNTKWRRQDILAVCLELSCLQDDHLYNSVCGWAEVQMGRLTNRVRMVFGIQRCLPKFYWLRRRI